MEKIDKSNFRKKIFQGENRCTVLFTAPWCGFCKSMKLMLEKSRQDFENMDFYLVDIDEEPELKNAFSISAVPTMIVFEDSRPLSKATGLLKKSELYTLLGSKLAVK